MLGILYIVFSRIKNGKDYLKARTFTPLILCKLEQCSRCVTKILYTRYGPKSFHLLFNDVQISLASSSVSAELSPLTVIFISSSYPGGMKAKA